MFKALNLSTNAAESSVWWKTKNQQRVGKTIRIKFFHIKYSRDKSEILSGMKLSKGLSGRWEWAVVLLSQGGGETEWVEKSKNDDDTSAERQRVSALERAVTQQTV